MNHYANIDVTVVPRSSKSRISVGDEGGIRVHLNSPPVDGKANEECISLFSRALHIPRSSISIIRGEKGRRKCLRIEGLTSEEVLVRLTPLS